MIDTNIKLLRDIRGLSPKDLAAFIKSPVGALSHIENGMMWDKAKLVAIIYPNGLDLPKGRK